MELDQELLISCATGLGCWKEDGLGNPPFYFKTRDCVECLKDLQRFLRQDDVEKRPAFFALGKRSIAQSDLVPLLTWFPGDTVVAVNAVKIATFLTLPPDPDSEAIHKQIEVMQHVKEAFLTKDALAVVVGLVAEPLSNSANMTEQAAQMVQLVVTFVRNLLRIPDCSATAGARGNHRSRMTNDLLTCLFDNDVMDLLLLMAQRTNQGRLRADTPLLLEVFSTIFKDLDAQELLHAQPSSGQTAVAGRQAMQARGAVPGLREQFAQEKAMVKVLKLAPRHPRHGGTFVKIHREQADVSIVRNVPAKATLPTLPSQKPRTALTPGAEAGRGLDRSLMVRLRQYVEQFLETSYGLLMGAVRRSLEPGLGVSRLGREDFLRFLSVARLCTAFVRLKQEDRYREQVKAQKENRAAAAAGEDGGRAGGEAASPFAAISATMGWETFRLVQMLWLQVIDLPPSSKEKDWELQHSSLSLLKEMLVTLDLAKQTGSPADKRAADRLSRRLLHDDQKESGLLPVLSRLLKGFSFKHQPRSHAKEIVEAIHITLRLLERLSKQELGAFLVKRKAPVRRKRAAPPAAPAPAQPGPAESGSPQGDPQEGGAPGEEAPVGEGQAAADEPAADAATPRGPAEAAAEGEPGTVADDGSDDGSAPLARAKSRDPFEEIEDEEDLEAQRARTREVAYNLNQRVRQELAFPAVIHLYTWLLQSYKTNSSFLNHCIVTLLQRIASPAALNLEPMLYQLSILRVFEQILSDTAFRGQPNAPELLQFCKQVTRNLFARLLPPTEARPAQAPDVAGSGRPTGGEDEVESTPQLQSSSAAVEEAAVRQQVAGMMFLELMFWKNQKEAEDVREEYNWKHIHRPRSPERSQSRSPRGRDPSGPALSQAQEQRLQQLFEEHGMEKGYVETIAAKLEEGWPKARVARALKGLGLKRGTLTDVQRDKLQKLFEEHRRKRGFLQLIAEAMGGSFRKSQISTHLRKLGLKRPKGNQPAFSSGSDSDSVNASGSEGGEGQGGTNTKKKRRAKADWSEEESEASQPPRSGSRGHGASGSQGTGLAAGQKPTASDSDEEQPPASSEPPGDKGASTVASEDQPEAQPRRGDRQEASPSGGSSPVAPLPGPASSEELSPGKAAAGSAGRASGKRRAGALPQLQAKQKAQLDGALSPAASPGSGTEHDRADMKAMPRSPSPGHSPLHITAEDDEAPSDSPMPVPGKRRRLARRAAPIDIDMGTLEDI